MIEDKDGVSPEFRKAVDQARSVLDFHKDWPVARSVGLALMSLYEGEQNRAISSISEISLKDVKHPWEFQLYYELMKRLYGENSRNLEPLYRFSSENAMFTDDVQLYFASKYLRYLTYLNQPAVKLKRINSLKLDEKREVSKLYEAEKLAMQFEGASYEGLSSKDKRRLLRKLRKTVTSYNKYSANLVRVSYIRILEYFRYTKNSSMLTQMSRGWLGSIKNTKVEYNFAVEQLVVREQNAGYSLLAENNDKYALQTFYYLIRKDEFYAGWAGLVDVGYSRNQIGFMDKQLSTLKPSKQGGRIYGEALYDIYKGELSSDSLKGIDDKISKLERLSGYSEDAALRYLLIGYLYQKKFDASKNGYKFSRELFEKAHRNYMISLDMLHTNARARAAVLENLAWLHLDARNYSFASELFLERSKLLMLLKNLKLNFRGLMREVSIIVA